MKENPFIIKQDDHEVNLFTKLGYEDYLDEAGNPRLKIESEKTYAKSVKDKLSKNMGQSRVVGYSYYVKTDPNKNLYNPIELHTIEPNLKKSFINKICKSELKFTEVSSSVFLKYMNFLKTENVQWLNEAQREIR